MENQTRFINKTIWTNKTKLFNGKNLNFDNKIDIVNNQIKIKIKIVI